MVSKTKLWKEGDLHSCYATLSQMSLLKLLTLTYGRVILLNLLDFVV